MENKSAPVINSTDLEEKSVRMPERQPTRMDSLVLTELERLRAELVANISQEFRTPLTSIKGFASTLLQPDVEWSDKDRKDFLESIEQETERLSHLISSLLDVTQLGAGILKLNKSDYRISEIMSAVAIQLEMAARHHPLQIKISPNLPVVCVDRNRIGQVIVNLVRNAAKYSTDGSPVTINAKYLHNQVIVRVIDKGVGIPFRLCDKVFDRFHQIDNIVSGRQSQGSFGLSICKDIIEAHGCKIWVESKIGEGSRFSFNLPVSTPA
jgi:two-component system, OmpR family, sensor histidine kinase KdpD